MAKCQNIFQLWTERATNAFLEPQQADPPGSNPPWRGTLIAWCLRRPFLANAKRAQGILCSSGVSVLRPCAWNHLKRVCATLVRSVGRTTNTKTYFSLCSEKAFRLYYESHNWKQDDYPNSITQSDFLARIYEFKVFLFLEQWLLPRLNSPVCPTTKPYAERENRWILTFPKIISTMWKSGFIQYLKTGHRGYISKFGDLSRGWTEGSFFNSYHTEV